MIHRSLEPENRGSIEKKEKKKKEIGVKRPGLS